MVAEVETYDQYLTGDVYGYVIESEDGTVDDSCWGFFGLDHCIGEAKEAAKLEAEYKRKREAEMDRFLDTCFAL